MGREISPEALESVMRLLYAAEAAVEVTDWLSPDQEWLDAMVDLRTLAERVRADMGWLPEAGAWHRLGQVRP